MGLTKQQVHEARQIRNAEALSPGVVARTLAELSPAQRAGATARRKQIYVELHPETSAGIAGGRARQGAASANPAFAEATASATGRKRRTVELDAERGTKITDRALAAVAGTPLDKGSYLDKLKAVPAEEQAAKVEADLWAAAEPSRGAGGPPQKLGLHRVELGDVGQLEAEGADAVKPIPSRVKPSRVIS